MNGIQQFHVDFRSMQCLKLRKGLDFALNEKDRLSEDRTEKGNCLATSDSTDFFVVIHDRLLERGDVTEGDKKEHLEGFGGNRRKTNRKKGFSPQHQDGFDSNGESIEEEKVLTTISRSFLIGEMWRRSQRGVPWTLKADLKCTQMTLEFLWNPRFSSWKIKVRSKSILEFGSHVQVFQNNKKMSIYKWCDREVHEWKTLCVFCVIVTGCHAR